jgi:3',5'-cyclic AMP phosphodiesterase CpdA
MRTIVHLSDLHFGRVDDAIVAALPDAVAALCPDVVAISGDLTQRARHWQFRQARAYLDYIADFVGVPIRLVGVGPDRDQVIWIGLSAERASVAA